MADKSSHPGASKQRRRTELLVHNLLNVPTSSPRQRLDLDEVMKLLGAEANRPPRVRRQQWTPARHHDTAATDGAARATFIGSIRATWTSATRCTIWRALIFSVRART